MSDTRWPWWKWPQVIVYRWWMLTPKEQRTVDRDWWKCYR